MKFDKRETLENYIHPELIPFLKENDIYDKFIYNLRSKIANSYDHEKVYIPLTEQTFIWNNTPEGYEYWSEKSDKIYSKYGNRIYTSTNRMLISDLKKIL